MISGSDTILLVEDNDDDVFGLRRALNKAGVTNPLRLATDGQQAVDYLTAAGEPAKSQDHPLPFLVLLDLKLPYRDGFEVLEWIRRQPHLEQVIVVMLTGSDERRDHQRAYALGARSYLVKPASADDIKQLLESLRSHWVKPGPGTAGSAGGESGPVPPPPADGNTQS
jgi:CheY-like chemotaxis protein